MSILPSLCQSEGMTIRMKWDTSGRLVYFGSAPKGSLETEEKWTIKRFGHDGNYVTRMDESDKVRWVDFETAEYK